MQSFYGIGIVCLRQIQLVYLARIRTRKWLESQMSKMKKAGEFSNLMSVMVSQQNKQDIIIDLVNQIIVKRVIQVERVKKWFFRKS